MSSPKLRRLAITAAVLVLVAPGCATHRPGAVGPAGALPTPQDLQAALTARRAAVTTMRALARVRLKDAGGTVTSRQAVVVERPARLRVEVLSAFGAAFVLTVEDGQLRAYVPSESTVYSGAASADNLARYAGVGLAPEQLVDLLLGTPPTDPAGAGTVAADAETGWLALTQPMAGGTRITWFRTSSVPAAVEDRDDTGGVLWRASFDGYEDHGGVALPTRVVLEAPPLARTVDISLNDLDVNPRLDASVFAVRIPPNARVVSLDAAVD